MSGYGDARGKEVLTFAGEVQIFAEKKVFSQITVILLKFSPFLFPPVNKRRRRCTCLL